MGLFSGWRKPEALTYKEPPYTFGWSYLMTSGDVKVDTVLRFIKDAKKLGVTYTGQISTKKESYSSRVLTMLNVEFTGPSKATRSLEGALKALLGN